MYNVYPEQYPATFLALYILPDSPYAYWEPQPAYIAVPKRWAKKLPQVENTLAALSREELADFTLLDFTLKTPAQHQAQRFLTAYAQTVAP